MNGSFISKPRPLRRTRCAQNDRPEDQREADQHQHQAAQRDPGLGLPFDRIIINIDRYGNTTAGTIPLATRDALTSGRLKKGDLVMFAAVGAGYTVGAALWRWAY